MNEHAPFLRADLDELDALLLARATRVVPMRDVFKGDRGADVIGLRHDVDDNVGSWRTAQALAEWECEHGYSATYYLLHGSHYWGEEMLCEVPALVELGHEVGIHVNALAEGLRQDRDPGLLLIEAVAELRNAGVRVDGSVAHGDPLCYDGPHLRFVNDELFTECARPDLGPANRILRAGDTVLELQPFPRQVWGLEYDANWLPRGQYLSDSGGHWSQPVHEVALRFATAGQLHMLLHPDWWANAFLGVAV